MIKCFFCLSIEDNHSYQVAESIRKDIEENKEKKDVVILALGTKSDLKDSRQVELVQAMNWAASKKIRVVEVTASDRSETVLQVFFFGPSSC